MRVVAWAGLLLTALFLLTTGGTYPGIASVEAHIIGQVAGVLVLGGWSAVALVRPAWRPTTPLVVPIALAAAAYVLAFVFSQRQRLSLEPTIAGLGWALGYLFLARLLAEGWFRTRVAVLMTAFVAVVAFGYIGQVLIEWWTWWGLVGRFAVPPLRPSFAALFLGSPNLIGTALILLAPLVVAVAWSSYRSRKVAVALAVGSAMAVFLSGSRGAYLGVGVAACVALGLAATRVGLPRTVSTLLGWARARRPLLLPIVLLSAVGLVLVPSFLNRFAQGGGTLRLDLWRSALSIFLEHPAIGAGPGTWVQLKVAANPPGVPNLVLPHAHNMYVQAAAEVGVVGALALAVLAIAVLRRVWSGSRSVGRLSLQSAAVLVSLAAFAAQSMVDNLVNLPMILVILVTIVAWVDSGLAREEPSDATGMEAGPRLGRRHRALERGPLVPALAFVGLAAILPRLLDIDRAALLSQAGSEAALSGRWEAAYDAYDGAVRLDPGFALYELQAAGALARTGRIQEARDVLARATEEDPVAINLIGLAALEAELGNREAALAGVERARALGIGEPAVALNAGLVAEHLGLRQAALDAFAQAIAWNPSLASAGLWSSPVRLVTKSEVLDSARSRVNELDAALILAYGGSPAEARVALETLPASRPRDIYIAATIWLTGDQVEATTRLEGILQAAPADWYVAAWLARITGWPLNPELHARYSRWAIALQADSAPAVIDDASIVAGSLASPLLSVPLNYPWAVYLRPIWPYPLMPQIATINAR